MTITLAVRNESRRKYAYRTDDLRRLAERVCRGERYTADAELSVLFCDDAAMSELNGRYRRKHEPTDVLSFCQDGHAVVPRGQRVALGDIVISLETVEERCGGERAALRHEVRWLFCHGLLHILGWKHDSAASRERMIARQAHYLGLPHDGAGPRQTRRQQDKE